MRRRCDCQIHAAILRKSLGMLPPPDCTQKEDGGASLVSLAILFLSVFAALSVTPDRESGETVTLRQGLGPEVAIQPL
jgi:hypothetical protein